MAINKSFEELYNDLKNNVCYIEYQKGGDLNDLTFKATLNEHIIPSSDIQKLEKIITRNELYFNYIDHPELWEKFNNYRKQIVPNWIKVYSLSYKMWINIEIAKIIEFKILNG